MNGRPRAAVRAPGLRSRSIEPGFADGLGSWWLRSSVCGQHDLRSRRTPSFSHFAGFSLALGVSGLPFCAGVLDGCWGGLFRSEGPCARVVRFPGGLLVSWRFVGCWRSVGLMVTSAGGLKVLSSRRLLVRLLFVCVVVCGVWGAGAGQASAIAPPCADLQVAGISFSPTNPVQGLPATVSITVKNAGSCAAGGFVTQFKSSLSSPTGPSASISSLAAGASQTLNLPFVFRKRGTTRRSCGSIRAMRCQRRTRKTILRSRR